MSPFVILVNMRWGGIERGDREDSKKFFVGWRLVREKTILGEIDYHLSRSNKEGFGIKNHTWFSIRLC